MRARCNISVTMHGDWLEQGMRAKEKTPAAVNELRLRTRTALLGLESKDVQGQAHLGAQSLISDLTMDWEYHQVLRDLLIVDQSNLSARRLRYRYNYGWR